jgi:hypothetical protein
MNDTKKTPAQAPKKDTPVLPAKSPVPVCRPGDEIGDGERIIEHRID